MDESYIWEIGQRVRNFQKKGDLYNCSCPVCGDSKKDSTKARGYFYLKQGSYSYKCHNCGFASKLPYFLKTQFPELFEKFRQEKIDEKIFRKKITKKVLEPTKPKKIYIPKPFLEHTIKIPRCDTLPEDHIGVQYLSGRKLPLDKFFYADSWKGFLANYSKKKAEVEREGNGIIIPCVCEKGFLLGFQIRFLEANTKRRYGTYQANEENPVLYGLEKMDRNRLVYICESPFDSHSLDNCIAVLSASLFSKTSNLGLENVVYIWDNEPRSKEISKMIFETIEKNLPVVIWPKDVPEKDMNEMSINGKDVRKIVRNRTFVGVKAMFEYELWKK